MILGINLLCTLFTRLPDLLHIVDIPVGTTPGNNIINQRVRPVIYVGEVGRKLPIVVQTGFKTQLRRKVIAPCNVKVSHIQFGVGYQTTLVVIRQRKAHIVFLARCGYRYVIVRQDTRLDEPTEVVFSARSKWRRLPVAGKRSSIWKLGRECLTRYYRTIILRNQLTVQSWSPNVVVAVVQAVSFAIAEGINPVITRAVLILYFRNGNESLIEHLARVHFHRKTTLIFCTAFGRNQDGPVLTPETIQGGGRCAFQHRVGIDIVGTDVPGIRRDRDTIDHKQHIGVTPQRNVRAAQQFRRSTDG